MKRLILTNSPAFAAAVAGLLLCFGLIYHLPAGASPRGFNPQRAGFSVVVKDIVSDLAVLGVYVLPEEIVTIGVSGAPGREFRLECSSGTVLGKEAGRRRWRAPSATGLYRVTVTRPGWACGSQPQSVVLNVFVMVPYDEMEGGSLCGYRIGRYPSPAPGIPRGCDRPRGFIEVTAENMSAKLSPHFRLSQFLCKQQSGFPKYVLLEERLLVKLERILEKANERGHECDTFHIMSGYRTPHYNSRLGNVKYSQHLWGKAADIFIDHSPRDGMMDDLDGNGKIDVRDAAVLYRIANEVTSDPSNSDLVGGLAKYKKNSVHGPFVHVDVRGQRARWGI